MRITVIPEQLRQVAQAFRAVQSGWEEIGQRLRAQQSALDWEVHRQQVIEEQFGQALRLAQALARGAAERASWLETTAARFEAADREAYQPPALSFRRTSVFPIPQVLGVWATSSAVRGFLATRLIPDIVPPLGGLVAFALGGTLLQPRGDLAERVWNWILGYGWCTNQSSISEEQDRKSKVAPSRPPILDKAVTLKNQQQVLVSRLDGKTPAEGLDNSYGKPGQLPLKNVPVTSTADSRHPELYAAVINQFGVEGNPRYTRDEYTYCNTFAGDVARAMNVPLPIKSEKDPATAVTSELLKWFTGQSGQQQGWREVNPHTAEGLRLLQEYVNAGKPAFAVDEGHIAVIRPGQNAASVADLRIAQAGAANLNDVRLEYAGLGSVFRPRFFIHD